MAKRYTNKKSGRTVRKSGKRKSRHSNRTSKTARPKRGGYRL